jgi:hypothetical protein
MPRLAFALLLMLPAFAQVKITPHPGNRVDVEIDGKPFTSLHVNPKFPKPFLHPLRTADGKPVTRAYPIEPALPGEPTDHPHQRGLWFAHGNVNGYNFWAPEPEVPLAAEFEGRGAIVLERLGKIVSGKNSGSVSATFDWKTSSGEILLIEDRTMTFYSDPQVRRIDFDATLSPQQEVTFKDTKEGMFAIRLGPAFKNIVNAKNQKGEKATWGKRAAWVDFTGQIDGATYGVAVIDHPENPRYPAYWHVREYGLLAANIFGVHDFENDPSRDGSLTIRPGQPLRFRYRILIHPAGYVIPDTWTK